ncbi:MAG: conjugal transfer protein TraD [Alphaproteobacteria bacterium]|nr:conjugal transfer protein TraD [Alphaproteobacteria bacterium]
MRRSLEEHKAELEKKKIFIMSKEKLLKERERKERTRKLIEMGGLIEKAGIDSLETATLYGALLSLKEKMKKAEILQHWNQQGSRAFIKNQSTGEGIPLVVQFTEKPSHEARLAIRSLGLKWNAIRQEWQGIANLEDVEAVTKLYNGNVVSLVSNS